jgi:hypothetical protein
LAAAPGIARPLRLTLLGIGAMNSPRYRPAGLLVEHGRSRVMIDGGPGAVPRGKLDAWLVTDDRSELAREIRDRARTKGLEPRVEAYRGRSLRIVAKPVVHTAHATFGYLIEAGGRRVVWAPEFLEFPRWAARADLMFAEASGWCRPIRFAKGTGGHASTLEVALDARRSGVKRLVFAHVGRPTIRALDAGGAPPWGELGREGACYVMRRSRRTCRERDRSSQP